MTRHSGVRVAALVSLGRIVAAATSRALPGTWSGAWRAAMVLAATGCAPVAMQQAQAPNEITAEQIEGTQAMTAYEAIQKLQPNFLVSRGPTSLSGTSSGLPNVYLDNVPYGPLATLRDIPAQNVALIRMYRAGEATYKFGTGNMGGVIEVFTKH